MLMDKLNLKDGCHVQQNSRPSQIASPSKSRPGFAWATVGPWDLHGLGLAHPNPTWAPPGPAHCWPVMRSKGPCMGTEWLLTMRWSWASPCGARLGINWASPCPDESHSSQSSPDESRLGSERARYLGSPQTRAEAGFGFLKPAFLG